MILVTLAYMDGWTYVRTIDDVMAIKPKAYFLSYGAARGAPLQL